MDELDSYQRPRGSINGALVIAALLKEPYIGALIIGGTINRGPPINIGSIQF